MFAQLIEKFLRCFPVCVNVLCIPDYHIANKLNLRTFRWHVNGKLGRTVKIEMLTTRRYGNSGNDVSASCR